MIAALGYVDILHNGDRGKYLCGVHTSMNLIFLYGEDICAIGLKNGFWIGAIFGLFVATITGVYIAATAARYIEAIATSSSYIERIADV